CPLSVSAVGTQPLCFGQKGSIQATAAGAVGTISYSLNGGSSQPSDTFIDLDPSTYTVTATDSANGCIATSQQATINAAPSDISAVATPTQPQCFGQTGSI